MLRRALRKRGEWPVLCRVQGASTVGALQRQPSSGRLATVRERRREREREREGARSRCSPRGRELRSCESHRRATTDGPVLRSTQPRERERRKRKARGDRRPSVRGRFVCVCSCVCLGAHIRQLVVSAGAPTNCSCIRIFGSICAFGAINCLLFFR